MKKVLIFIIATIVILSFISGVYAIDGKHGTLISNETWSNLVFIDGDLIIPENITLTISSGSRIIFRQDDITHNRYKLVIYGQLIANGTDANPIKFEPEKQPKLGINPINQNWYKPSAWQGIVITGERSYGVFTNCIIQSAYIGISIESKTELRKCRIIQSELASIEGKSAILDVKDSQFEDGQYGIKGSFKEITATGNSIRNHQFGISCRLEQGNISNNTIADNADAILLDSAGNNVDIYHNNIYRHNSSGIVISLHNTDITITDNELADIGKAFAFRGNGVALLKKNTLRRCQYGIYVEDVSAIQVQGTINDTRDPQTNSLTQIIKANVYPYQFELKSEQTSISDIITPKTESQPDISSLQTQPFSSTGAIGANNQYKTGNSYIQGKMDGSMYAKGEPAWVAAGLLLGPLGVLFAYVLPNTPPIEMVMNRDLEYTFGFTESYKSESRSKNAAYAFGGWLGWILIYFAFMAD